jgi:phosphoglycolate phosphatase
LYLGDTATDMKTAKAAGMFAIGALWGFRDRKELEDAGADAIASVPEDVLNYLK